MGLSLSGWLPGEERQGLTATYDAQVVEATKGKRPKDVLVVGVLRRRSFKKIEDSDEAPVVEVRFHELEVATGEAADDVRVLIDLIRERRNGLAPMIGEDGGVLPGAVAAEANGQGVEEVDGLDTFDPAPAPTPLRSRRK